VQPSLYIFQRLGVSDCWATPYAIGPLSCLPVLSCPVCDVGVLCPNGWMEHIVLDGDPASPPPKGHNPNFRPISSVAKWLHASMQPFAHNRYGPLSTDVGLGPDDSVRWGPSFPAQTGVEPPPQYSAHVYCGQTAG